MEENRVQTTDIVVVEKPEIDQYNTDMSPEQGRALQKYNMENSMQNIFGLSGKQLLHARSVANMYQIKHGLSASIPIICKGDACPYINTCTIPQQDRIVGARCPQEIGAMIARYEGLCRELAITDDDVVDAGLVKDVVDFEMMMIRADNKLAASADVLAQTIVDVDVKGKEHYGEIIDPVIELKMKLFDKKIRALEKLNSTRKDKADAMKKKKDPSVKAATLMSKAKLIQQEVRKRMIQTPCVEESTTYTEELASVEVKVSDGIPEDAEV